MVFTADKPAGNDTLAVSDDSIRENFRNLSPARDLFAEGFVQSGIETSINGSNQARLDVTAGIAYVKQTSSSDVLRYDKETTFFTTSVASTTYYLDLNEDGTHNWDTSHSSDSNYLPIAEVTTDSAGDISSLTDVRDTKPLLDMVLEDASKIAFDDSNFGADTAAVSDVAGALNLLADSAVIDEGSTADGYYIRFENGWQICFAHNINIGDYSQGIYQFTQSLPVSYAGDFTPIPVVHELNFSLGGGIIKTYDSVASGASSLDVRFENTVSATLSLFLNYTTIGRWK